MRRYKKKILTALAGLLLYIMLISYDNPQSNDNMVDQISNEQQNDMSVITEENNDMSLIYPVIIEKYGEKNCAGGFVNQNDDNDLDNDDFQIILL